MGHQKAALEILTQLYTPQSAMQTPMGRMLVSWYARFDVFVGVMSGFGTALPREWFAAYVNYCSSQAATRPDSLRWKIDECSGQVRLISRDMSILSARSHRGEISPEDFSVEHDILLKRIQDFRAGWDFALTDPSYLVTDFGNERLVDADDIVNPYMPGDLYDSPIFATTLLISEWHSMMIMHKIQSSTPDRMQLYGELAAHAYAICHIFEAVEFWPGSPKGSLILIQACIALAVLFLPQDSKHHMWIRRKFALLETMG